MSKECYAIAAIPKDPDNVLDIIRSHVIVISAASGEPQKHLTPSYLIAEFDVTLPGLLEACYEQSAYDSIEQMMKEACKNLGSKNVVKKLNTDDIRRPLPAPSPSISVDISSILQHPIIKVYKINFFVTGNIDLPVEFEKIVKWYGHMYRKKLTPAVFSREFDLDPQQFKEYAEIVEKSEMFFVHQYSPLHILAYTRIRVAIMKAHTQPV